MPRDARLAPPRLAACGALLAALALSCGHPRARPDEIAVRPEPSPVASSPGAVARAAPPVASPAAAGDVAWAARPTGRCGSTGPEGFDYDRSVLVGSLRLAPSRRGYEQSHGIPVHGVAECVWVENAGRAPAALRVVRLALLHLTDGDATAPERLDDAPVTTPALSLAPGDRGQLAVEGAELLPYKYHADLAHEVTFTVDGAPGALRGPKMWFRYPLGRPHADD